MNPLRPQCRTPVQAKRRRGAAAVEFALVAPLLGMFVIGMCELSRVVMVKESLTDAARHGCRSGIVPGANSAGIVSEVNHILEDNRLKTANQPSPATVTILVNDQTRDVATALTNDKISVKVSIPYPQTSWMPGSWFMTAQSVESETMVMLRQ